MYLLKLYKNNPALAQHSNHPRVIRLRVEGEKPTGLASLSAVTRQSFRSFVREAFVLGPRPVFALELFNESPRPAAHQTMDVAESEQLIVVPIAGTDPRITAGSLKPLEMAI